MQRFARKAVTFGMVALAGSAFATAQTLETPRAGRAVEISHNVYHTRACPTVLGPGFARCHAHVVTDGRGNVLINLHTNLTPQGYGPSDLRSAYHLTATGGSSSIVAIVDAYGYPNAEADLAVYRSTYGLPACTSANGCFTKLNETGRTGHYPAADVGWSQESALDLDMASSACPNCRIVLIEANTSSYLDLAIAENLAAALHPRAISNSYGGPEYGSQGYEAAYNHPGIAITVSSGDSGYGVQFPASSPHVTAVGGTSLYRAGTTRGWSEQAWSGAGSGCSAVYGKPIWQHDPLCTRRMEADVSAIADPSTGVAVYGPASSSSSAWLVFGGTSVAAPLIAGVYAANGGSVTYGSNPYSNTGALFDVTSGSNGSCGGTYFCTAGPGYDGPTGLGTPNGSSAF